jgi:hypothetical protein
MNRIPFTLPDVGLREIRGLVYLEDGFLVLRIKNAVLGLADEKRDMIKIEPKALRDVRIERGLFRDRLVIRPRRADLLDAVPGEHPSAVTLRVGRKHRAALMRLVDEFETLLESSERIDA